MISGGIIQEWGTNARLGKGEWMIVEADESDGTFVRLPTQIGIVTNIDPEHLDYFKSVENMHREFETFFRNIPFYGLAVTCIDHPVARDMIERLQLRRDGRRLLTYGTTRGADLVLRGLTQERGGIVIDADLGPRVRGGERQIRGWCVPIPGQHNALNALAAIAAASEAGIADNAIRSALATFTGVKRRFELTGDWNGASIYDDYAHHPAEISAVLGRRVPAPAGASSPCSSRIAIRACTISSANSAPASAMPTASSWHRSIRPASSRSRVSISITWPRASAPPGTRRSWPIDSVRDLAPLLRRHAARRRHGRLSRRRHLDRVGARAARLARRRRAAARQRGIVRPTPAISEARR